MAGGGPAVGRRKYRAEEIINCQPHVGVSRGTRYSLSVVGIPKDIEEHAPGKCSAPTNTPLWLEAEMRNQ
jgi:hypothetical protein